MGVVVSFPNTKGGSGKSTMCWSLGNSKVFNGRKYKSCIVGTDPQGTIEDWIESAKEKGVKHCHYEQIVKPSDLEDRVSSLSQEYDFVLIDLLGESETKMTTRMGMALSDIIIIPLRNSTPDINAFSRHLFHMIVELKESKKKDGQIFFPFLISSIRQSTSSKDKIKGNLDNGETIVMDNFFMKMDSIYQNLDGDTLESLYQNSKSDLVKDKVKKCIENVEAIGKEILKKSGL